jgi:hypothetical protein
MKILHIKGTQCSGKTYIIQPFLDRSDIDYWDVLEFYKEYGCIVNNQMDWDKWEVVKRKIPNALTAFLEDCNKKNLTAFVESGTNTTINRILSQWTDVTTIELHVPDEMTLRARAKERETDPKRVIEFRNMYLRRHATQQQSALSTEEARATIKAKLDGLNFGIIGTAGRGVDGNEMSKTLYGDMYRYAQGYINKLQLNPQDFRLVSGGAAWSDHLAVSLYLASRAHQLRLHLPAPLDEGGYVGSTSTARATNKYHQEFGMAMGKNSLSTINGLNKAIAQGAEAVVTPGFKPRDLKIARDAEALLAFTWGDGDKPKKESGTAHTWNHCTALVKLHVPLREL